MSWPTALKPIVLPGETMRVFILKEGKEYNQGVAYLDDGTMVVVDNAKKMISKTIDISVTSVLQTTAGKMIFGKFDERMHAVARRGAARPSGAQERSAADAGPAARENHDRIVDAHESRRHIARGGPGHPHGKGTAEKAGTSRKQFMLLDGSPILMHTVRKFAASRPGQRDRGRGARAKIWSGSRELLAAGDAQASRVRVVEGGNSRQESVENALALARARIRTGGGARRGAAVHRSGDHRQGLRRSGRDRRGDRGHRAGGYREAGDSRHDPRARSAPRCRANTWCWRRRRRSSATIF